MRVLVLALVVMLFVTSSAADIDPFSETFSKLSRRHLLYQKHRLFQPKILRLANKNNVSSDTDDGSIKHEKKSKFGNDWYELDETLSLTDAETTEVGTKEKQVKVNVAEDTSTATDEDEKQIKVATIDDATNDEIESHYSIAEDCIEQIRRRLAKRDKAGKGSKAKTTLKSKQGALQKAQAESKSGKSAKAKTGKQGKASIVKCHTLPPKTSSKPTGKPSQEQPSRTSSPTTRPTSVVVTEPPISETGSPTSSPPVTAVTASPTTSPSKSPVAPMTTQSPSSSPTASPIATDSPLLTASPSSSPSVSDVVTQEPTSTTTTESPTSATTTESPTPFDLTISPSSLPSTSATSIATTEIPTSDLTNAPSNSPSASVTLSTTTESPTPISTESTYAPSSLPSTPLVSMTTSNPSVAPSSQAIVTEAPVLVLSTSAPTLSLDTSLETCTFCDGGIPDPEAEAIGSGGLTCSQVKASAEQETNGSVICDAFQDVESTCCPQSRSCAPLDPNPYTFEPPNNVFPKEPWTTGGDGVWEIDDTIAQEGTYSIRSPDLDGSEGQAASNATLAICDDFGGGVLTFNTLAPVVPPYDILIWYVDGFEISRLASVAEWSVQAISLTPGPHRIDFQYQYNPFSIPDLPGNPPPNRQGAVWIDAVLLQSL